MSVLKFLSDIVFPPRCPCCGELNENGLPCENCAEKLADCVLKKPICKRCGNEKQRCGCGEFNPLFNGAAAAYFNASAAREGIYGLKFGKRSSSAVFFGEKMAQAFEESFPNITPDAVCIVPTLPRELRQKDYDYVHLLAKTVSRKLELKYKPKLLKKIKATKRQHKLSQSERAVNVKGAFKAAERLDGKCILLVDDIKTTGYTLNECAKQLRLAGADSVYCVTALISPNGSWK